MPSFTKAETKSHLTAQFRWVPFVARLMGEGPLRGASDSLDRDPGALNQESLTAVKAIINRAVWRFLARECGWTQRRIITAGREQRTCRLWQQQTPPIRFTDESVELLLDLYNGTRGAARISQLTLPKCHEAPGDLLLHHLVFLRLHSNPQLAGIGSSEDWAPWLQNPLSALRECARLKQVNHQTICWDALLKPELFPYLPWVLARTRDHWLEGESQRWSQPLERLSERLTIQTTVVWELIQRLESMDRPDLLAPILEYIRLWFSRRNEFQDRFEALTRRLTMRDRQKFAGCLSEFLLLTRDLTKLQSSLLELHPVDRGAPAKLYLSTWENLDFSKICCAADEFRQQINPTLT